MASGAVVVGDVEIGEDSSVWFTSVIRADSAPIRIGRRVNIQDGSVLHVDEGMPVELADDVTVGHRCIVHGARIGAGSLVGMGATVMNGVVIGERCLVGAGSLVTTGKVFGDGMLILGSPARAVRALNEAELASLVHATEHYVDAGRTYKAQGYAQSTTG